jgi:hypothetical protein
LLRGKRLSFAAKGTDMRHRTRSDLPVDPRSASARWIGVLFLAGFLSYGTGFGLVSSVIGAPHFLSGVPAHRSTLLVGAFLMLLNSLVDVGKGVLFFPILDRHSRRIALTYLATMIVEVVLLALGVLCLLMLVPLATHATPGDGFPQLLGTLAVEANGMAYQVAEMLLGLGCLFLCSLLFRARLLPRWLSAWGWLGYAVLSAGTIAEICGIHIGLACSIPGGLFEIMLGFWLIFSGFEPLQPTTP